MSQEQKRQDDQERWRIFCAIELPPEVRARVAERIATLRAAAPGVRASWDRAEKLHTILRFLDEMKQIAKFIRSSM